MVVSEIGEQWSPMTEPANTEATTLQNKGVEASIDKPCSWHNNHEEGRINGYRMAIVPHEVPVEKPIKAAKMKVSAGTTAGDNDHFNSR